MQCNAGVMGGSQSQERVVTVEERAGENGDPQITVIYAGGQYSGVGSRF